MPREDRAPGFMLYPDDLLNDPAVVAMSDVAFAGYVRLWLRSWGLKEPGVVPYDPKVLGRLSGLGARWKRHEAEIVTAFDTSTPGVWRQARTVRCRQEQVVRANTRHVLGLLSAYKRGEDVKQRLSDALAALELPLSVRGSAERALHLLLQLPIAVAVEPESEAKTPPRATRAAPKGAAFTRPSLAEVQAYCQERALSGHRAVDPQAWFDHYEANGWRVGRNAMKDWRAAVRTWERNGHSPNGNGKPASGKMDARMIAEASKLVEVRR